MNPIKGIISIKCKKRKGFYVSIPTLFVRVDLKSVRSWSISRVTYPINKSYFLRSHALMELSEGINRPVLEACVGSLCWKPVLEACVGSLCWKPVLEACVGSLCWKRVARNAYPLSFRPGQIFELSRALMN